jgi:hypothetical protein
MSFSVLDRAGYVVGDSVSGPGRIERSLVEEQSARKPVRTGESLESAALGVLAADR